MTLIESVEALGARLADVMIARYNERLKAAGIDVTVNVPSVPDTQIVKPKSINPCSVPGCARRFTAKGLCQGHYAKANRMKMNLDKLRAADLRILSLDGRKTRVAAQKRNAPAKNASAKRMKKSTPEEQPKQATAKVELPTPMF